MMYKIHADLSRGIYTKCITHELLVTHRNNSNSWSFGSSCAHVSSNLDLENSSSRAEKKLKDSQG